MERTYIPGGRYWEPQEDPATEAEQEKEWQEFLKATEAGIKPDEELPFR